MIGYFVPAKAVLCFPRGKKCVWTKALGPLENMREKIDQSPLKIINTLVLKFKKQQEKQRDKIEYSR